MIQVCKLRAKTRRNGDDYVVGRMGGVRVLAYGDGSHVPMIDAAPACDGARALTAPAEAAA